MSASAFEPRPGQEVAVLDGPDGRPVRIDRVLSVRRVPAKSCSACGLPDRARCVTVEGRRQRFLESPLGFSRGMGRRREFLSPATEEHRLRVRRAGQLALLQQSQSRFKDLPSPALEEILRTLDSYLPGGVGRVDPSRIVPMGTMK